MAAVVVVAVAAVVEVAVAVVARAAVAVVVLAVVVACMDFDKFLQKKNQIWCEKKSKKLCVDFDQGLINQKPSVREGSYFIFLLCLLNLI